MVQIVEGNLPAPTPRCSLPPVSHIPYPFGHTCAARCI